MISLRSKILRCLLRCLWAELSSLLPCIVTNLHLKHRLTSIYLALSIYGMKLCPYMDWCETTSIYGIIWNYFAKVQWFYALISSLSSKKLFIWHFIWRFFTKESLFSDSFVFQALLNSWNYVIVTGWCSYLVWTFTLKTFLFNRQLHVITWSYIVRACRHVFN